MESPFSLLVWFGWAGQADSLQKTLDNAKQQLLVYEDVFFSLSLSVLGTFLAPAVLRTAHSDLHLPTSQLLLCRCWMLCLYPRASLVFLSECFFFWQLMNTSKC